MTVQAKNPFQVRRSSAKLTAVISTLEESAMYLGVKSEFPELENQLNDLIKKARAEQIAADDYLKSYN